MLISRHSFMTQCTIDTSNYTDKKVTCTCTFIRIFRCIFVQADTHTHTHTHTPLGSSNVMDGNILWREEKLLQPSSKRWMRGKLLQLGVLITQIYSRTCVYVTIYHSTLGRLQSNAVVCSPLTSSR